MDEAAFLWFYGKAAFLMGQFLNLKRGASIIETKTRITKITKELVLCIL